MAELLKGAPVAEAINERAAELLNRIIGRCITPRLALLCVGEREVVIAYEYGAAKGCELVGVK
ncbi:MAG: bifunctional 5,10-methylene-tetrahydrofolate dehydrogenase/5,10-methylene-tetrahydrofolate cyclohydrolase, partial [Oscillospiraceae bacterium]|nr:bifunctional 5,10-methylene-tetrahydrofolate dehydrogenase/5,10-methylene-tetrahydrofolate cyclohydrolase [Oscillospiraceae bacterium]